MLEHLDGCTHELERLHTAFMSIDPKTKCIVTQEHHMHWQAFRLVYSDFYNKLLSVQLCLKTLAQSINPSPAYCLIHG